MYRSHNTSFKKPNVHIDALKELPYKLYHIAKFIVIYNTN